MVFWLGVEYMTKFNNVEELRKAIEQYEVDEGNIEWESDTKVENISKVTGAVRLLQLLVEKNYKSLFECLATEFSADSLSPILKRKFFDIAVKNGHLEFVKYFLEQYDNNINLNVTNPHAESRSMPLHVAAENGYLEIVELLISRGADVDLLDVGCTPLSLAAENGHLEVVELLISSGANVDLHDGYVKRTPLHLAAIAGCLDVVKLLISSGADVNLRDCNEHIPRHLATIARHLEVAEYIQNVMENGEPVVNIKPVKTTTRQSFSRASTSSSSSSSSSSSLSPPHSHTPSFPTERQSNHDMSTMTISCCGLTLFGAAAMAARIGYLLLPGNDDTSAASADTAGQFFDA